MRGETRPAAGSPSLGLDPEDFRVIAPVGHGKHAAAIGKQQQGRINKVKILRGHMNSLASCSSWRKEGEIAQSPALVGHHGKSNIIMH
jgi:hypothetical protein